MMSTKLNISLKKLDMISENKTEKTGLVFTSEKPDNPYEYVAIEEAQKYAPTAIYFRRFADNRPPIPQIYIYDYSSKMILDSEDKNTITNLHRQLWNSGHIPLFYIFTQTEVLIFNCYKEPKFNIENNKPEFTVFESIDLAAKIDSQIEKKRQAFSAKHFDNGTFLESSDYRHDFDLKNSAYETLLARLKDIWKLVIKIQNLPQEIAQKLLVMSILVKYLEERKDQDGNTVFPNDYFAKFVDGATEFIDVFKVKGACLQLFDNLSDAGHFNGQIFRWENKEERRIIEDTDLQELALFLEGKLESDSQYSLWRLYDFNHLPIELISNIYEEFLGNKPGVVYTPPFLVNFLINECMPLEEPKEDFKVLDPACGSGIFLVAAYKRIIQWWRSFNNWQKPNRQILQQLLRKTIFGVDKDPEAIRLAFFSLSLALCDLLTVKEIWEDLKFENLTVSNLKASDFFKLMTTKSLDNNFDLVIGNPPFGTFNKALKSTAATHIEEITINSKKRYEIPDKEISLLFAEQAINLTKPGGLQCFILPAGKFLYNNRSFEFRKYFFEKYDVPQIIDFTHIARVLFKASSFQSEGGADVATLALFSRNQRPDNKDILHITVRRTKPVKEKIYFELDHYDFHYVPMKLAISNKKADKMVWKSNYLGGGRIHCLMSRLAKLRTLKEFLQEQMDLKWIIQNDNEIYDDGEILRLEAYLKSGDYSTFTKKETDDFFYLKNKYDRWNYAEGFKEGSKKNKKASYITGRKTLPTKAFTNIGINEDLIHDCEKVYFSEIPNETLFSPPHILLKKGIIGKTTLTLAYRNDYLTHMRRIIGIHAPKNQEKELRELESRLKDNKLYLFFIAAFSAELLVSRATSFLKNDIDNLPYPESKNELELFEIEQTLVDDVLNYMIEFRSKGENAKIVKKVSKEDLDKFAAVYCKMLNTVYKNLQPYKQAIFTKNYVCLPFYFGEPEPNIDANDLTKFEQDLNQLLIKHQPGANLRVIRLLRIYEQNIIYIIKPNQLRYWLRSVAVKDADETFVYLSKSGY